MQRPGRSTNVSPRMDRAALEQVGELFKVFGDATRLAIMQEGKFLQLDTPENIYVHPENSAVASFFGHCQFVEGEAHGENASSCLGSLPLIKEQQGKVKLLLRPENIKLRLDDQGLFEIKEIRFLGDKKEVTVANEDLTLFVNAFGEQDISPGQRVSLSVRAPVPAYPA